MKRRTFLGTAAGAGALAAVGPAAAQAQVIKIGFVASFSGIGALPANSFCLARFRRKIC